MGQFILVRGYGVAGGEKSKTELRVKADIHVRRVAYRTGLTKTEALPLARKEIYDLSVYSPADFDLALWDIGREFCHPTKPPECSQCPINLECQKHGIDH